MNNPANKNNIIGYRGIRYEIDVPARDLRDAPHQDNQWHLEQLSYCMRTHDYVTLENRISNGLKFGWIWELDKTGCRVNGGGDEETVEQDPPSAM